MTSWPLGSCERRTVVYSTGAWQHKQELQDSQGTRLKDKLTEVIFGVGGRRRRGPDQLATMGGNDYPDEHAHHHRHHLASTHEHHYDSTQHEGDESPKKGPGDRGPEDDDDNISAHVRGLALAHCTGTGKAQAQAQTCRITNWTKTNTRRMCPRLTFILACSFLLVAMHLAD